MNKRMWVFNFITQYSMKNCLTDMQTACYNSLGQVLTPEPTSLAQRFKGSYLLEKDGLWQQWGRWGRSKDVNLSSTQETIGWSETGRFFRWKFLFGTGKKKRKKPPQDRKILPAEHYPGIPEGLSCLLLLLQVLPTENLGPEVSVTSPYKWRTWKSNTCWTNTHANKLFIVL